MYLYYTTFVPAYLTNPVVTDISTQLAPDWEMGVRVYGGCEQTNSCPAFSLNSKGYYQYQPEPTDVVVRGRVPAELVDAYDVVLTEATMVEQATRVMAPVCASDSSGLDYRLQVTLAGARYDLNTCGTALSRDSELITLVRQTISYLDNPASYSLPTESDGRSLRGRLEQWLQEQFTYDEGIE
jgi:hypothetical protein